LQNNGQLTAWQTFTVTAPTAASSILEQTVNNGSSAASLSQSDGAHASSILTHTHQAMDDPSSTIAATTIDLPDRLRTSVSAINDVGHVVVTHPAGNGPEHGLVADPSSAITNAYDNLGVRASLSQTAVSDGDNVSEGATTVALVAPDTIYSLRGPASNLQENAAIPSAKLTGLSSADTFVFNSNPSKEALAGFNITQHELALDHTPLANATPSHVLSQTYEAAAQLIPIDSHNATPITGVSVAQPQSHLEIFHLS
jgi:hypothetical protein